MLKKYVIFLVLSSLVTIGCAPKTGPLVSIPARTADTEKLALGGAQLLKVGASGDFLYR